MFSICINGSSSHNKVFFIILCIPIIINAGPGLFCNGNNFSDLTECCTEEYQCGLYQGNCATDSQCKGNLKCGTKNCKVTSNETTFAENWQKFNCCYNGMSIRKKIQLLICH